MHGSMGVASDSCRVEERATHRQEERIESYLVDRSLSSLFLRAMPVHSDFRLIVPWGHERFEGYSTESPRGFVSAIVGRHSSIPEPFCPCVFRDIC